MRRFWLAFLALLLADIAQAQSLFLANDGTFKAPISGGVTISGPAAAGNVPVASSASAAAWANFYNIPATWTALQTFNVGIAGTLVTGFGQAINMTQTPSGSTAATTFYNLLTMTDTAAITGANFGVGFQSQLNFGGSSTQGGREAIQGTASLTAATSASNANRNYVGVQGLGVATANDNGTSPNASATAAGAVFGLGGFGALNNSAATSYLNLTGAEFNTRIVTGASAFAKSLAQFSSEPFDRVQGTVVDSMLWLYNQSASNPGWNTGILFDGTNNVWPIKSTGTIVQTLGSGTAAHGVDLSATTFSADAFKSTGFVVAPNGNPTIGTTGTSSGQILLLGATSGSLGLNASTTANNLTVTQPITIGITGITGGSLTMAGATSGNVIQLPQAVAGTPTITWGNTSGTPAVTASSPLAITAATGNATCTTCATTTNGGALTATSPMAISAGGVISINSAAAWTAFTATPTCGTATITTTSARSQTHGKTTWIQADFNITAIGTCTTNLTFTLPNTAQSSGDLPFREYANASAALGGCMISGASSTASCFKHANAVFAVNDQIRMSGVYENQ